MAINDWTHKAYEFPVPTECSEIEIMIWLYNLRITCPSLEIYIGDDDVSGELFHIAEVQLVDILVLVQRMVHFLRGFYGVTSSLPAGDITDH